MRTKLPSASALFTFEAAAKTMSFSEAGRLLNVTQPAVSKGIAALEDHLGVKLFKREKAKLALTAEGESLHQAIQLTFMALETAIDRISSKPRRPDALTLSLSTAFAAHWLIPQMDEFRHAFPDTTLNFQLTCGEAMGPMGSCDLGLRLDSKVATGDRAISFAPEWLIAVASPDYIARNGMLDRPANAGAHTLVTLVTPRIAWQEFLELTNQAIDAPTREIRVPDYSVVIQTALNGRGVALGYVTSCGYLIREGLLVPALPRTLRTGRSYCLVYPGYGPSRRLAEDVGDWIISTSQAILASISGRMA
ncbi:LysR family transcriptional regulator [Bradyrhizobium sp. SSUT18]|uniref:LysR family transcriptional regulator n=1 Tax=Bradyrhizobium sp. SSUT18 TaxID=3040602 RepID=UPI00244A03CE|nr:LysR family transcriptional regulator [Bradyrhizobium sp. SSUT18]MDH2405269.1 LysR family transcriptional regulator [Bradyrhizobium sp. SSUT18]